MIFNEREKAGQINFYSRDTGAKRMFIKLLKLEWTEQNKPGINQQ